MKKQLMLSFMKIPFSSNGQKSKLVQVLKKSHLPKDLKNRRKIEHVGKTKGSSFRCPSVSPSYPPCFMKKTKLIF